MGFQTVFVNIVIEAMEMGGALKQQGLGYRLVEGSAKGHSILFVLPPLLGGQQKQPAAAEKHRRLVNDPI